VRLLLRLGLLGLLELLSRFCLWLVFWDVVFVVFDIFSVLVFTVAALLVVVEGPGGFSGAATGGVDGGVLLFLLVVVDKGAFFLAVGELFVFVVVNIGAPVAVAPLAARARSARRPSFLGAALRALLAWVEVFVLRVGLVWIKVL